MPPKNPVDSWPAFELHGLDTALRKIFPILLGDEKINAIILMIACMSVAASFDPEIISSLKEYKKPIITYFVGNKMVKSQWTDIIRRDGGVVFDDINTCVKSIEFLYLWNKFQNREVF